MTYPVINLAADYFNASLAASQAWFVFLPHGRAPRRPSWLLSFPLKAQRMWALTHPDLALYAWTLPWYFTQSEHKKNWHNLLMTWLGNMYHSGAGSTSYLIKLLLCKHLLTPALTCITSVHSMARLCEQFWAHLHDLSTHQIASTLLPGKFSLKNKNKVTKIYGPRGWESVYTRQNPT